MKKEYDRTERWFDRPWYNNPLKAKPVDPEDNGGQRVLGGLRNFVMFFPNLISKIVPIGLDVGGNILRCLYKPITETVRMVSNQVSSVLEATSAVLIDHPTRAAQRIGTTTRQAVANVIKSPFKRIAEAFRGE